MSDINVWIRNKIKTRLLKIVKEQNGYILGLVLIFFVIFTIMGLAFMQMAGYESLAASKNYARVQAFYNAEAGIHKGLWLVNKVSNAAGTFSNSTVSVAYDSVNLIMTATGQAGNVQKAIQVTLESSSGGSSSDIWPYAVYGGNDVKFGSGTVTGDVHANNTVTSGSANVSGNTTSGSVVDPPTVDWNFYKNAAIASSQFVNGDKTFTKTTVTGVWYVTGTATLGKNTSVNGSIIAENNINLTGKNIGSIMTASNCYPVLVTKNSIVHNPQNKYPLITGIVYSINGIQASKTFKVQGAVISGTNTVYCENVAVQITYDSNYTTDISGMNFGGGSSSSVNITISSWSE